MSSRLRALRVVHPFPSFLNAGLVLAVAWIAGGTVAAAVSLALGMLGIQFCIGIANDICDAAIDAATKPWKAIAAGLVSRQIALSAAIGSGFAGIAFAASQGVATAALAVAMLACGLVYDLWLKPTVWAWLCFSVAFAVLPVYAWYGASGTLPPLPQLLVPLAAIAGPALQLSNGLVDLEEDRAVGLATLATRLGRERSVAAVALLVACVHGLAWLVLVVAGAINPVVVVGSAAAIAGVAFQAQPRRGSRAIGWSLQATSIALLGVGWVAAVS